MKANQTVFISSTYNDLILFRKEAWNALDKLNLKVKGMERFGARKEKSLVTCLNQVASSDIYIGIIAFKFGSIDPDTGKSYTQLEYEKAVSQGKQILIYFPSAETAIPSKFYDNSANLIKLEIFKEELKENHTIDHYLSPEDLGERIESRLSDLLDIKPLASERKSSDLSTIEDFCVMPKKFSGVEFEAEVEFTGIPFPASKLLCKSYGFEYGRAAGIPFKFVDDDIPSNLPRELFFKEEFYDSIKKAIKSEAKTVTVVLGLEFSEESIKITKANFKESVTYSTTIFANASLYQTTEPDGHILLNILKIN